MEDGNKIYEYSKITQLGTIRLILLHPSDDLEAGLSCSLIDARLQDCDDDVVEHYIAISYVWGEASENKSVLVDGKYLGITASLDQALRNVRDRSRVLRIWADGICINQNDVQDRNTQVAIMDSIYATARHTIIFLGPSNSEHELFLRKLEALSLSRESSDKQANPRFPDGMLEYPWFGRVWILQELALSPDPRVQIGSVRVRWSHFSKMIEGEAATVPSSSTRHKLFHEMCQIRSKLQGRIHLGADSEFKITILDVLQARRGLGITDPKDMIYAHLGISESQLKSHITIDYSKSKAQVYEEAARYIDSNSDFFSILTLVEKVDLHTRSGLPTWVPDWSVQLEPRLNKARVPISTTFSTSPPRFKFAEIPGVLVIPGYYTGRIVYIASEELLIGVVKRLDKLYSDIDKARAILECLFTSEMRGVVEILLTYCAYYYKKWSNDFSGTSAYQYIITEEVKSSLEAYLETNPSCILEHITNLSGTTRKILNGRATDSLVLLGFLVQMIFELSLQAQDEDRLERGSRLALAQKGQDVKFCFAPAHSCVGDLIGTHSSRKNIFLFRPNEQEPSPEDKAMIRQSLSDEFEEANDYPSLDIRCCTYVGCAPIQSLRESKYMGRPYYVWAFPLPKCPDTLFAIH
ncbi:heterokaryon incompatibility protein-domain-containing protein [Halenospora varia]|nr:heterokaryon incompatibility protein-domain-containing protein [Halenospora varia]